MKNNIYASLLLGRPFYQGVPGNPYLSMFQDLASKAHTFRQNNPVGGATIAQRRTQQPGANMISSGPEYRKPPTPSASPFGGMNSGGAV